MTINPRELFDRVLETYAAVGKTAKPQRHEHTTLAAVAVSFGLESRCVIIALATGTKCLPNAARRADGTAVHDSHAEVLVRRTTVRWLMDELENLHTGKRSMVFEREETGGTGERGRAHLRPGVAFHLVVSAAPCGDCAIVGGGYDSVGGSVFDNDNDSEKNDHKRQRTGAKVVRASSSLPGQADVEKRAQRVGVVRRKPGKGSPTSSTSCSDKILRWMHLGFQGCLLRSLLEEPLYFSSVTAVGGSSKEEAALRRGAWERQAPDREQPVIRSVAVPMGVLDAHGLCMTDARTVGAGYGASWWSRPSFEWRNMGAVIVGPGSDEALIVSEVPKACKDHREVLVGKLGYKASANCKSGAVPLPQFHSRLCRSSMRKRFCSLTSTVAGIELVCMGDGGDAELKRRVCPSYVEAWARLRKSSLVFRNWIDKA